MRDTPSITAGLAVTLVLHLIIGGGIVAVGGTRAHEDEPTKFAHAETIEASLAFKEVKPKNKQPQKKKKQKFKAKTDDAASKKEDLPKEKEKKDESLRPEEDEVDFNAILEKNRKQDEDLSDTGSDEIPVEGSATGSDWGTEREAKGNPYVGELKGRIYSVWKVPALETGEGKAIGCVRLDEDGKIVDRELKKRSKNSNLDRSVEVALKEAPDMDKPVPEKLISLLTVNGICFKFVLD